MCDGDRSPYTSTILVNVFYVLDAKETHRFIIVLTLTFKRGLWEITTFGSRPNECTVESCKRTTGIGSVVYHGSYGREGRGITGKGGVEEGENIICTGRGLLMFSSYCLYFTPTTPTEPIER